MYDGDLPVANRYFTNPRMGGSMSYADFCPFYTAWSNGDCRMKVNGVHQYSFHTYGPSSRCMLSNLRTYYSASVAPTGCFEHKCTVTGKIQVTVRKQTKTCDEDGQLLSFTGFMGAITCPPASVLCANSEVGCDFVGVFCVACGVCGCTVYV